MGSSFIFFMPPFPLPPPHLQFAELVHIDLCFLYPSSPAATLSCHTFVSTFIACDEATTCPTGYYCTGGTLEAAIKCASGKYCPEGSTTEEDCEAGLYCSTPASDKEPCPKGSYCPAGVALPIGLTNGHYATVAGSCARVSLFAFVMLSTQSAKPPNAPPPPPI
jgi:hypothetical protein